jgi:Mn2+/Fe2+ NRAMP family transporter
MAPTVYYLSIYFETGSHLVAQAGLELVIFLLHLLSVGITACATMPANTVYFIELYNGKLSESWVRRGKSY